MDARRWIWEKCFLGKELSARSSVSVITRHVIYTLVLWCFEDGWQVSCESNNTEEGVVAGNRTAPGPAVPVELKADGSVPPPLISASPSGNDSEFPVHVAVSPYALSPEQIARLNSPGAVDTSNFKTPTAVYVSVPIVALAIAFCSIYCYCSWKKRLRKNRYMILEKVAEKHRRASMKPGSLVGQEMAKQAAKFGLSERSGKSEHDPAALITFSAAITGLAVELETVEQKVMDYQSYNAGEAIPEFHKVAVEGEHFSVTINPLYNSLQSGACGYVLSGKKTPFIRFTDERRTSVPFMLENSLYLAPPPPSEDGHSDHEDDEEDEDHEEDHGEDDEEHDEEGPEGESSTGATEATSGTSTGGESPSSDTQTEEIKPERKKSNSTETSSSKSKSAAGPRSEK